MPNDEDIMDQLKKIDDDEILGEEINLDDDLDFDGLDDMDNESSTVVAPTIAPPAPRTETSHSKVKTTSGESEPVVKPAAKKASKRPKTTKPVEESPAQAETSVTEVEEVVVRAKTLRIIADKVIIEPGNNISFSP